MISGVVWGLFIGSAAPSRAFCDLVESKGCQRPANWFRLGLEAGMDEQGAFVGSSRAGGRHD